MTGAITITRFAPSPTGRLHLGHAFSALFAERAAGEGGCFLLRIEDIDLSRCRSEFVEGIYEDLAWLGLRWPEPVRRQSEHFGEYRIALDRLDAQGLLYPCFCTRAEILSEIQAAGGAPQGPDGPRYPGTCRTLEPAKAKDRIEAGEPHALRLDVERAMAGLPELTFVDREAGRFVADPRPFGDVVLARKDVPASYHLAVTRDDALQGVTLVTRGIDLLPATHIHRLLQELLSLPVPEYHHHGLLLDEAGRRLAKRDRSRTLAELRAASVMPEEVRAMVGF